MSRSQLSRIRTVAGFAAGIASVMFTIVKRNGDILVTARVASADPAAVPHDICEDGGKIKLYKDVDDFLKGAAKLAVISVSGLSMGLSNVSAMDSAPFTGDLIKRAMSQKASFVGQRDSLVLVTARQATELALMTENSQAEIALKSEKSAQNAAALAQLAYVNGEIARLTALLAPAPVGV